MTRQRSLLGLLFLILFVAGSRFLAGQPTEPSPSASPAAQSETSQAAGSTDSDSLEQMDKELDALEVEASSDPAATETTGSAPAIAAPTPSPAPTPMPTPQHPNRIVGIDVRGNKIVSTNAILNKMKSQKEQPLVQETVNEDIKRLYAAGFFQDIKMEVEEKPEGYKLIVEVVEKPIVRQIIIEGFTKFKEDRLRKEMKLLDGQILDHKAIKQGVEAIKKLYNDKGFRFVDVQSEVDVNRQTKEATVYIRINEGEKYKIKGIRFEGAKAFKPKKLSRLMKTKKKGLFRPGVFKEAVFQKDLERVRLYYQQEGYLDVKIEPSFDYDQKEKRIFIKILLDEGKHYVTGDIKIEGNRLFPESEIWQSLEMLSGFTYSQFYLSRDLEYIRDYYHQRGYMDARVVPDIQLNRETGKVDIKYQIQEGDLYFVEKIVVRGNTKTRDGVIRRELRIRPGEKFDGAKIAKSKQRLENLDYFEEVTYDTEPASSGAPNRRDLIFRVKEKRTGELSFGGGISSVDRFVGFAEISQRNFDLLNWPRFTGGGQSLSLSARIGSITQNFNVSFVEPYLFNKPISFATDLFNIRRDNRNVDFDEERRGFNVNFSRLMRDIFRLGTGYTLERVTLDDLSEDAPAIVREVEGNNWLSRWRAFTSLDTRDSVINPLKGTLVTLNGDLIGGFLGGDQDYYILQTSATQYVTLQKRHTIELKVRLGIADEFGNSRNVPVFDRFYAGGLGTVRGFNYRRVGPIEAGDAIGGKSILIGNLEYTFPIPYLEAFKLAAFTDAAHVDREAYDFFGRFSISVGPGIKIKTPIGPMAFYYGFPVSGRDEKNRNGRFEFSLSRGF